MARLETEARGPAHVAEVLEIRAACTTCWQDLHELKRRHVDLEHDAIYRVLEAALEQLALPAVTSVSARVRA